MTMTAYQIVNQVYQQRSDAYTLLEDNLLRPVWKQAQAEICSFVISTILKQLKDRVDDRTERTGQFL